MKKLIIIAGIMAIILLMGCTKDDLNGKVEPVEDMGAAMQNAKETFSPGQTVNVDDLKESTTTNILSLEDGDTVDLRADIIVKEINGKKYKMYGYNGQIPGPIFKVKQDSTITVQFTNNIEYNTTIHWHGLRHNNKDDGVPDVTQPPVQPGDSWTYTVSFPDAGIYWYHPHIREDIQQDAGLAGNLWVLPASAAYFNQVNREELLLIDDILIKDDEIVPYGKDHANLALMGRFGNVMLVNGKTDYTLQVKKGEVVRFYITNVANVRPFNLSFGNAKIKLIGSDLGKYEKETFVDSIIIAPAERYIAEVYFEDEGEYPIQNINPQKTYTLGMVRVNKEPAFKDYSSIFYNLKQNEDIQADIASFKAYFDKPVDYQINLTIKMPKMKMMQPMEEEGDIEWEESMKAMNAMFDAEDITWILKDSSTGKQNMDIDLSAKVGDKIKLRLFNDKESMHPMQHPIHLHGQRFLVLSIDGVPNDNLVWKDTVLVPIGKTVDILIDVTNPGNWMLHCHISEHLEAGMMASFKVD